MRAISFGNKCSDMTMLSEGILKSVLLCSMDGDRAIKPYWNLRIDWMWCFKLCLFQTSIIQIDRSRSVCTSSQGCYIINTMGILHWISCRFISHSFSPNTHTRHMLDHPWGEDMWCLMCLNTLRPRQNDRHFTDDKCIFLMKIYEFRFR